MAATGEANLYPLFLKLERRTVLVVGAGEIAERKIASLLEGRARVRVVAQDATPGLQKLARDGDVEWRARAFVDADVDGVWLVVAATASAETQRSVAAAASARHTFVIAVDDPANASAYSGSVVRRAPFTIAISSSGETPALTRLVREVIEHVLPADGWVDHAKKLRARWIAEGVPIGDRFGDLVRGLKHLPK